MEKLVNDYDFKKVELCMSLFAKCSLAELRAVEQLHDNGELSRKVFRNQNDNNIEQNAETIEHCMKPEPNLKGRLKYKLID